VILNAETNEKQARSIKYQLTIAQLPLAKDLDEVAMALSRSYSPPMKMVPDHRIVRLGYARACEADHAD
jgi:hypothetical protein